MKQKYQLIDLFCGAGGMTLGFVDDRFCGDFQSIFAIDNDKAAVETFNSNFGEKDHCVHENIESWLEHSDVPSADIVIGGPPCQGFSLLNKNRTGDVRRELWEPYIDIVVNSGAPLFIMENVPGLLKSLEFSDIHERARDSGFSLHYAVLNTADYGVPQIRKRAIVFGIKEEEFDLDDCFSFPPNPTHRSPAESSDLPVWNTVKDFIGDLPRRTKGTEIRFNDPAPLNLHFGRNPTDISKERYRAVPPGGNRFDLQRNRPDLTPQCWIKKKSGGTDLFGRLWWDRPSVTIRTEFFKPEKGRYLHPSANRPISHREAARIMSFPDDFQFFGTKIEIAKQIGNAVPPVFAGEIAQFASRILDKRKPMKQKRVA